MSKCLKSEGFRKFVANIVRLKAVIFAIITRLVFSLHCLVAFGRIAYPPKEWRQEWMHIYWLLLSGLVGLLVEAVTTIYVRKGAEYKWFCPSVFFYLITIVPCVWILELNMLTYRLSMSACSAESTPPPTVEQTPQMEQNIQNLTIFHGLGVQFQFEPSQSVVMIEQLLLFVLILGRWMLPKGDVSRDELSQLLLVYIGMAADIIEFFEAFKEDKVKCNPLLIGTILGIWSASLLQFTLVLTASKAKKSRAGFSEPQEAELCNCCNNMCSCCGTEVFGIVTSMVLQDGPFLTLRLLLLVKYEVSSYMHIFFTVKNTLVLVLMCYRLFVLFEASKDNSNAHLQELIIEISSASKELEELECNRKEKSTTENHNALINNHAEAESNNDILENDDDEQLDVNELVVIENNNIITEDEQLEKERNENHNYRVENRQRADKNNYAIRNQMDEAGNILNDTIYSVEDEEESVSEDD